MKTIFQQLGPYEIIEAIGHGMAGSVFLARDTRTDQRVALKLVPHGSDGEALEIVAAERWGAELQRQLSQVSGRVPAVYEHGDHEAGYYVAMEYLDGENLSSLISRGPLTAEHAADIGTELCLFLEDAHCFEAVMGKREFRSLVHGDLTPRNVRITAAGKVKVLDFGIAKALSLSRKVTRNDFGTLWYLSPERLESGVVDEYADFWAIGVMLYEMVCAVRPFQAEDTRKLERLILSRHGAPPLSGICPRGLESVIAKLLAAAPADRYATARAIREDLERFKSGKPTQAEAEGWPRITEEPQTRRTQPPLTIDEERSEREAGRPNQSSDERTRRTKPQSKDAVRLKRRWISPKVRTIIVAALLVIAAGVYANDVSVGNEADQVAESVPTLELDELLHAWDQHRDLSRRAYFSFGVSDLANVLTERTQVLAGRVIANYRTSLPTVREAQWQSARDALLRAVAADPENRQLRAELRYCEGHLHRINGEAKRSRRESGYQQDLTEAVAAFRESAELREGWPDPFLGLARTFIYGLQDVDRGADALHQAELLGYEAGERETVQLADGYRSRGDTLARNARQLETLPQERDYLARAAEAYRQALALYLSIKDFSRVGPTIRQAQQALDRVEKRLGELSQPGAETIPLTPTPEGLR
jgi:serine/threonine protein kinase